MTLDSTPVLLSVEDYLANPMGGPTPRTDRTLTEAEIYRELQTITRLMNEATFGQIGYHVVYDEIQKYHVDPFGQIVLRLVERPVRFVTSMSYVTGQYWGGMVPAPALTTPVETGVPAPILEGNIVINRRSSIITVSSPRVSYMPGLAINPLSGDTPMKVAVTYSAGFDDGTTQPDGIALPAPAWLKDAVRISLGHFLRQRRRALVGRGLKGSYRIGNVSESYGESIDLTLPDAVQRMLARNFQNWSIR